MSGAGVSTPRPWSLTRGARALAAGSLAVGLWMVGQSGPGLPAHAHPGHGADGPQLAEAWRAPGFDADQAPPADATREALDSWDLPGAERHWRRLEAASGPDDVTVLALKGRLQIFQGRYDDAVTTLERAVSLAGGPMAAARHPDSPRHFAELARAVRDETRDYKRHLTASGRFEIAVPPGPEEVMVPYLEQVLERAYDRLGAVFQQFPATPVRVEIYPRREVLGHVSSLTVEEIETSGTIALCKYARLMVVSPRDLVYGYGWADTVAHEYAHLLITQKSRNRVPIWIHEGLAKYFERFWRDDPAPSLTPYAADRLAQAMRDGTLVPFEAMSPSMAKLPSQEATATAFAEVWTVIEMLVRAHGDQVAAELVTRLGRGDGDMDAVAALAGVTADRFQAHWETDLAKRDLETLEGVFDPKLLFRGQHTEAEELEALAGEGARHHTWLGDRLRLKGRWLAAAKQYRKAAALVGPTTPIVQSKLGYALIRLGRHDEAVEAMLQALPHYPGYALLRLYLGQALVAQGRHAAALTHLEAALWLNPFDPDLHGRLADVYDHLAMPALAQRERAAQAIVGRGARP